MATLRLKRADIILLAGVLLVGAVLAAVLFCTSSGGGQVQVRVDGSVAATYPLSRDASYTINGANGGTNLLVIEDGTARIEEASCPDGICVNTGRISRSGQSIVCLPNKVVVEIISAQGDDAGVDIVTG